jgi:acyltransferase
VALLYRLVSRLPLWAQWAVALAGLAAGFLAPHLLSHSPLGIGMALPCLIYVVAGASLKAARERVGAPLQTGLLLLVVCGACVALKVAKPLDLKHLNLGTPLVSVAVAIGISAALVLIAEPLMRRAPARLGGAITVLALASLTVVFLHPLIMWLMPTPPELRWVRMLVVLCVPWILGVVAVYTPAGTWLNGGKPRVTRGDDRRLPAPA